MTHPLTDEICEQITDELSIFSIEDCMRAAYDRGVQACVDWLLDYPETGMFPPAPEWLGEKMEKELLAHKEDNQ